MNIHLAVRLMTSNNIVLPHWNVTPLASTLSETYNDVSQRRVQWKIFIFIIFIILISTRLRMYEASVNTNCAYNSIWWIQACEYKNGNKGFFFFQFLLHLPVLFRILMFNSGEFCYSAADRNQVKEKWQNYLCKCFRDNLTC